MKTKYWIIVFFTIIAGIILYFILNNGFSQNNTPQDYVAEKTEAQFNNTSTNTVDNSEQENSQNQTNNESNDEQSSKEHVPVETEISTFTTKIYTKDSGRQNNISITCSSLNDTLVENGATFSFCGTVGQATTAKGYQKAEIFDNKR